MKVLFTTNILSPYRIDFFNELSKYCELTVLYERKNAKDRNDEWLKNTKIEFNAKYLGGIKVGKDSAFCPKILSYLDSNKFDIIIIGGYSTPTGMLAINYLRRHKIKFILNCDGGIVKSDSWWKYKVKEYFISSASEWITTGKYAQQYLEHYGADKEKIYTYSFSSIKENDILTNITSNEEKIKLRNELNIKEKNVIISVGQFIYRKGFDILIKSSQYLKDDIGIYIIGGKATEEYIKLKEAIGNENIHFVDFKLKDELTKYYKASDLFVFPTREDIWGLVINEAMSYGLPVITTDKCMAGLELIKNGENGYIVPCDNEKELANNIMKIINDDLLSKEMSINNINKIKKYTIESMTKDHINILNKLLKRTS